MLRTTVIGLVCCLLPLACLACMMARPRPLDAALADLNGGDVEAANGAYTTLFAAGAEAIPLLLGNVERTEPFVGDVHQDPLVSVVHPGPSQGLISLYLVEAVRVGDPRPHRTPYLVDAGGGAPREVFDRAVTAYRDWWSSLPQKTTEAIRDAPDPLSGTDLSWF